MEHQHWQVGLRNNLVVNSVSIRFVLFVSLVWLMVFQVACSSSGDLDEDISLAVYLGVGDIDPEDQFVRQERHMYEVAAACMAVEGFDYSPPPVEVQDFAAPGDSTDTREWASEWGFGISTLAFPATLVGPEAKGTVDPQENLDRLELDVSGLSSEDAAAFIDAFDGPGGCLDQGVQDAFSLEPSGLRLEFGAELDEIAARATVHPDVVQAQADAVACIRDNGIFLPSDLQSEQLRIAEQVTALTSEIFGGTVESVRDLANLQRQEIDLAVASFDCEARSTDAYDRVVAEFEREFIARNAAALEKHRVDTTGQ